MKKIFSLLFLTTILFFPIITFAGTTTLGHVCTQDADCVSTKCAQSTLTGAQTKFCVCINETQCETVFKKEGTETWTCKPGEDKTKGLPYCLSSTKGVQDPIAAGTTPAATTPESGAKPEQTPVKLKPPSIEIPIPNLPSFATIEVKPGEVANIPYIAQYIVAIYKYGLIIGAILAVMMIVVGGIMYIISSADPSKINTAKQIIFGSITGITVLICSYLMLKIINPNLVELSSIAVETIPEDILILEAPGEGGGPAFPGGGEELTPGEYPPTVTPVIGKATYKSNEYVYGVMKDKTCLNQYFFPSGLAVGDRVAKDTKKINILGLENFWERSSPNAPRQVSKTIVKQLERNKKAKIHYGAIVHKRAVPGWESFTRDLIASSDPEVKGYMQYIWDRADGKAPNFDGNFEPNDIVSVLLGCGVGMKRKTPPCPEQVPFSSKNPGPYDDPHTLGLAVDIMTRSNWDITNKKYSKSTRGGDAILYCTRYKKFIEKMKSGGFGDFFKTDPYKMYTRVEKRIADCLAGKSSFWSIPDGMIDLAVKNKFYWAGWAWADPWRADGMHFEYYGPCFGLKNETKRPQ